MDNQIPLQNIPPEPVAPQPPDEPPMPAQPEYSSSRNWLKISVLALGIVAVVAAIGAGGYLLGTKKATVSQAPEQTSTFPTPTPTPDPTANWKTFNSPTGKFSIKYPAEWTEVHLGHLNDSSGYEEYASFGPGVKSVTEDSNSKLAITVTDVNRSTSPYKTAREYMNAQEESLKDAPDLASNTLEDINIDGASGLKLTTTYNNFAGNEVYAFDKNGLLYVFAGIKTDFFTQILSTFRFTGSSSNVGTGCMIGGCSGQICQNETDEGAITTCEYKGEYACYKTAKCERQVNGQCGWTQTSELSSCLNFNSSR